jgi:hypothetical protein
MTRIVQHRRGTTSGLATILGAPGELFVDTSLVTVVVHDGATTGGTTLARNADVQTLSSVTASNLVTVSSNLSSVSSNLYTVIFAPKTLTTKQTFLSNVTSLAIKITNALEGISVSSTVATGTINFDVITQSILYFTGAASGNWTINFRANSSNSLDSIMAVGEALTVVHMVTNTGTASYNNAVTIDSTSVTPKWQGGLTPTAGNINSVDSYSYTIVKTASATFTVFATQTRFA